MATVDEGELHSEDQLSVGGSLKVNNSIFDSYIRNQNKAIFRTDVMAKGRSKNSGSFSVPSMVGKGSRASKQFSSMLQHQTGGSHPMDVDGMVSEVRKCTNRRN